MKVLIAGQGIAGSVLALTLIEKGAEVLVADPSYPNSASGAAAGLMHPLSGRRLALSWRASEFLPFSEEFYKKAEGICGTSFYQSIEVIEHFQDEAQRNDWMGLSADPRFSTWIREFNPPDRVKGLITSRGTVNVRAGWLNVTEFLSAVRNYLQNRNAYSNKAVRQFDIRDTNEWEGFGFDYLVLARGYVAEEMDGWPPMKGMNPNAGLLLKVKIPGLSLKQVFHNHIKLIPLGKDDEYLCGAGYYPLRDNTYTAESAEQELIDWLNENCQLSYTVLERYEGIRPATVDRRPLLGTQEKFMHVLHFNGFGSKGVMLAPPMAEELYQSMQEGNPPEPEWHAGRFTK